MDQKYWLLRLAIEWTLIIVGLVGIYFHTSLMVFIPIVAALATIVYITNKMLGEMEREDVGKSVQVWQLPTGEVFIGDEHAFAEFMKKVNSGEIKLDGETERREDEV